MALTQSQVDWAAQHDWFVSSSVVESGFLVVVWHDVEPDWTLTFDNFDELYAWAGY